MFGGAFVADPYSLALTGFFLAATYVTLLLSVDYIGDGDYYQGEFYVLLLTSLLGLVVMTSARDLITIFVALETISIPTFVLVGWRKHDPRSNEAAIKYYLIGVLSSAVMLYGMSLVFGITGSTLLSDIAEAAPRTPHTSLLIVAVFLTLVGFAFKISAVPFHFWAPDTYEGAPTPVTAFLSVASKAGGFVAMLSIVFFGLFSVPDTWQPILWVLAAASMILGNLAALRQTNIVRMLAYSSIAQGGFILVPFAVAADGEAAQASFEAVVIYLLIYGAMNLGAFAVVIAFARRTRTADITSYGGLGTYAPGFAVLMTVFMLSLAGLPPLAGWFAKFVMFRSVLDAGTPGATVLGVIAALMSVVAFFYYLRVVREMWFHPVPDTVDPGELRPRSRSTRRSASAPASCSSSVCTPRCSPGSASSPPGVRSPRLRPSRSRSGSTGVGRCRSARSSRPRCTTRTRGSSPAGTARVEPAGTSSPARRSVRCSARASPERSTGGGTSSVRRIRSWSWRRAPGPAGSAVRCCEPSRRARPRCGTCSSNDPSHCGTPSASSSSSNPSSTRWARRRRISATAACRCRSREPVRS